MEQTLTDEDIKWINQEINNVDIIGSTFNGILPLVSTVTDHPYLDIKILEFRRAILEYLRSILRDKGPFNIHVYSASISNNDVQVTYGISFT